MFELETVMLTEKNYVTFGEQLYWDKQHTFDRLNVSFVVTLTEHFYRTFFPWHNSP